MIDHTSVLIIIALISTTVAIPIYFNQDAKEKVKSSETRVNARIDACVIDIKDIETCTMDIKKLIGDVRGEVADFRVDVSERLTRVETILEGDHK